jgi:hypothetical protein
VLVICSGGFRSAALRAVRAEHDLRRWMFTDLVTIDETIRGGLSHPLTISPRLLVQRPALTLTTFLHEELHWLERPGTGSVRGPSKRWPDPLPLSAGGATDPTSTWLHMSVCALEYHSLSEILGLRPQRPNCDSMRATPGSTARSSPTPAGFPASCTGMASRSPPSLRSPAAASAKRGGQALTERRPGPRPPSQSAKAAHPEPSHGGTVTTDQHQLRSGQSTVTSGKQTRSGLANETKRHRAAITAREWAECLLNSALSSSYLFHPKDAGLSSRREDTYSRP